MFNWLKGKIIWFLGAIGLVSIAFASFGGSEISQAKSTDVNGKPLVTSFTDDNTGEDLIIHSDREVYGGWGKLDVYFSIENTGHAQWVNIDFQSDGKVQLAEIHELKKNVVKQKQEPVYKEIKVPCVDKYDVETGEMCDSRVIDSVKTVNYSVDEWEKVNLVNKKGREYLLAAGQTYFFKGTITIPNQRGTGKFDIVVTGDDGGIGRLDPWFNSSFTYCRKLTMTAGGTSGGVATTTTTGFPLVATSTIADLKSVANGGKVQVLDNAQSATSSPLDVVFTSGTDCNSDGGSLLDFYFEKYASTTGEFTAWVQATDISSTSAKTVLMYYGNSSATDQRNKSGVWDAQGEYIISNLDEGDSTGSQFYQNAISGGLNATLVDADGDTTAATAYVDGALNFNGDADYLFYNGIPTHTQGTVAYWFNTSNAAADQAGFSSADQGSSGRFWEVFYDGLGKVGITQRNNDTQDLVKGGTTISANTWYHVVAQSDGSTYRLWINGTEETLSVISGSNTGDWYGDATLRDNFNLGVLQRSSVGGYANGIIDDGRVYTSVLAPMDILTMYNNTRSSNIFWTIGNEETEGGATPTPAPVTPQSVFWF